MKQEYESTESIIESILYQGQTTLIGGDSGTKKSWIAMQCALSIASGVPLFEHFSIKPKRVLIVQFENENYDIRKRFEAMMPYYINKSGNQDWLDNINITQVDNDNQIFINNWDKIEQTLIDLDFNKGVLIVDNLYTSTDREIQDNHDLSKLIQIIHSVKLKHKLSMILIGHSNKGVSVAKCLDKDQVQGGKTLINFMANVVLVDSSRISTDLNLMKIVKGGRSDKNELLNIPFKLHWSDETCTFSKGTIIKNEAIHYTSDTERWEIKLIKYVSDNTEREKLDRDTFRSKMSDEYKDMNDTKLTRLLNKLVSWGLMHKVAHNKYQLLRDNIEDFSN